MYKREFENLLKNTLPKALMLYGEEYYLLFYLNFYRNRLKVKDEILNLYYDEYDFSQAKLYLSQTSLFGGVNLLLLRVSKAVPKKELDILIKLTKGDNSNYFLLLFDGEVKDAKKMQKSFENGGVWVRFFTPNHKEAIEILQKEAKRVGIKIELEAIFHLLESFEYNILLVIKELEKLSSLDLEITLKEIDKFVYSITSIEIDRFMFELFSKKSIIKSLYLLLEKGNSEFDILRAIQIYLNQISLFNLYIKINGNAPSSQEILGYGLPKHLQEQRISLAMRLNFKQINRLYEYLLEADLRLKKAKANMREAILYGVVIGIQKIL